MLCLSSRDYRKDQTMKQLFLIALLVLSSGPAYAEWVLLSSHAEVDVYVDPDTVRRKGDRVKMWELNDYKTSVRNSVLSSREQSEYDCTEERTRTLAITTFSGNMLGGKLLYSGSEGSNWHPVAPRTVGQALWKFACKQ